MHTTEASKAASVSFLLSDLDLALTMLGRAGASSEPAIVLENLESARRAYQTARRLLPLLRVPPERAAPVYARLMQVRVRLEEMGKRV